MATTQDGRFMFIATDLEKDFFLLNDLTATEGISTLYSIEVELLHEENEAGAMPTSVGPEDILGTPVTIALSERDDTYRYFNGIVRHFIQGNRDTRFTYYYATIVPNVWLLTQCINSKIFQQKTVPDILEEIFEGFDCKFEIQREFKKRDYCVQYNESDFDFASRLMEEEGIFYFFEHKNDKEKLIIADTAQSHPECPSKTIVPYFINVGSDEDFISAVNDFRIGSQLQTGKVTFWDYHFGHRKSKLESTQLSGYDVKGNQKLERYNFPGGYARKYDDVQNVFSETEKKARIFMESLDVQLQVADGISNFCGMLAGYKFELSDYPNAALNSQYVVTSLNHYAKQSPDYISDRNVAGYYTNKFTCIYHGSGEPTFRPPLKTPKPKILGSQTATVVGPAGEEIYTDKYGRVKVQFHWDREGEYNEKSSCWLRISQSWAGNKWGTVFIPRIGMEVVVNFFDGDPDQPLITGCVYNPEAMPPYTLPDEKTKATIKTMSSTGGAGFNEIRFEDKKDSEQIFIHAQKNKDIRVKNDCMETIINDRHLIVENSQFEEVKVDKHLKVTGNHNEKVDGTISVNSGMSIEEKAATKFAVDAGTEIHLKSGTNVTIETGTSLTLKVGGNFININGAGVFIKGTVIMLNSGGAAGSGSGSNPTAPTAPNEADKADPGAYLDLGMPRIPPPEPREFSQAAQVLIRAASNAVTFCEICDR